MSSNIILWNNCRSSASWRVRIALNLKNIEYEYKPINLATKEQYGRKFSRMNPKQEIPVIKIDQVLITQSLPIIEYLDEIRSTGPKILPSDPISRAKSRMIAELINSGIQPYQNPTTKEQIINWFGEETKNQWLDHYVHKGFGVLEKTLNEYGGKYCIGNSVSLADLFLVPQVYAATRFGVDIKRYEAVMRINNELEKIPAFKKAHAHRQVDTPDDLRMS